MTKLIIKLAATFGVLATLAGCDTSQGVGQLLAANATKAGPDEFGILPTKPLQAPDDYETLPEPLPEGSRNLVDPLPEHDAVAALGGNPSRLDSDRIGAGEGALINAASRNGVSPNVRAELAAEDKEFRKKNGPRLLERWFKTNIYFKRYREQTLESRPENARLRQRGVRTPSVPPEEDD